MSKEQGHTSKEGEKGVIMEVKTLIFVDEPYGCEAIEFYKYVFGATEVNRVYEHIETGDEILGCVRVVSAELQFGSSRILVSELLPNSSWHNNRNVGAERLPVIIFVKDVVPVRDLALQLGSEQLGDFVIYNNLPHIKIRDAYDIVWLISDGTPGIKPAEESSGSSSSDEYTVRTTDQ